MKLHEAIEALPPGEWFRPIKWRGHRTAYCIVSGEIYLVPCPRGGVPIMTTNANLLAGEWEIVSPDVVCSEKA